MSIELLRVWHIPNVLVVNPFFVTVHSKREALSMLNALADYDLFMLDTMIRGDFSNAQGVQRWDGSEWEDIEIEDLEENK